MKNLYGSFLLLFLLSAVAADAQRGGLSRSRNERSSGTRQETRNPVSIGPRADRQQHTSIPQSNSNTTNTTRWQHQQNNPVTSGNQPERSNRITRNNNEEINSNSNQRNSLSTQRTEQRVGDHRQSSFNNYQSRNFGSQSRYRQPYRYQPLPAYNRWADYRHPYSYIGYHYTNLYRPRIIVYSGFNYYYSGGFFYRPWNSGYEVVLSPVGIRVRALPFGFMRVFINTRPYYYYGGTYYNYSNDYYEVVEAPLGSQVPELPKGTSVKVIDGHKYYELNGTYYQEAIRNDGEIWYTVVGKNGVLNTGQFTTREEAPGVGDVVTDLPDNCTTVVLDNQKYYVSPDGSYFKEVIIDNTTSYKIVAKP